jgi:hypothetical protein
VIDLDALEIEWVNLGPINRKPATNGRAMKAKGSQFERDVVAVLRSHGWPHAERSYGAGRPRDVGDIDGLPGFCIEVKNCKRIELASFMDEAATEASNVILPNTWPVVVVKRRGKGAERAFAVMDLAVWSALASEAVGAGQ